MGKTFRSLAYFYIATTSLILASSSAQAAGFYLQEQSVSGLGSAYSNAASGLKDASTIWFNPAGMTDLKGRQVSIGAQVLIPNSEYKDRGSTLGATPLTGTESGNPYAVTPIPNLYFATPINENTWYGIGFNTPFGLASDYENSFIARYDSTYTSLQVYNLSNVLAYKVNAKLSVGGGIDFQYADADLRYAVNGGGITDAYASLKGDNTAFGFNAAVKYKPVPATEMGLTYRSAVNNKLNGRVAVVGTSGGVTPSRTDAYAKLDLPDIAAFGVTQNLNPTTRVSGNVTWYGWGKFDTIKPIATATGATISSIEQNYKNTIGFAVGGEHDLNQKWTVRTGFQYDPTPTRDGFRTTRTPDGDRYWFSGGATYKINDRWSVDMAATYIYITEESINVTRNIPALPANITGESEGNVGIVSAALNFKF